MRSLDQLVESTAHRIVPATRRNHLSTAGARFPLVPLTIGIGFNVDALLAQIQVSNESKEGRSYDLRCSLMERSRSPAIVALLTGSHRSLHRQSRVSGRLNSIIGVKFFQSITTLISSALTVRNEVGNLRWCTERTIDSSALPAQR